MLLVSWVSGYTSPLVHSPPINLSSLSSFLNMIYSSALCLLCCVYRSYQVNKGSVITSNHMLFALFLIYEGYWFTVLSPQIGSWSFFWTKMTIAIWKHRMDIIEYYETVYTHKLPNHMRMEAYNILNIRNFTIRLTGSTVKLHLYMAIGCILKARRYLQGGIKHTCTATNANWLVRMVITGIKRLTVHDWIASCGYFQWQKDW